MNCTKKVAGSENNFILMLFLSLMTVSIKIPFKLRPYSNEHVPVFIFKLKDPRSVSLYAYNRSQIVAV